jgi:hypothetical protein
MTLLLAMVPLIGNNTSGAAALVMMGLLVYTRIW